MGRSDSLAHPGRNPAIREVDVSGLEIGGILKGGGASVSSTSSSHIHGYPTLFRRGLRAARRVALFDVRPNSATAKSLPRGQKH